MGGQPELSGQLRRRLGRTGIAAVTRDHPAYPLIRDGNGNGAVCESASRHSPRSFPSTRVYLAKLHPNRRRSITTFSDKSSDDTIISLLPVLKTNRRPSLGKET